MANMFGTVDRSRLEHMRKLIGDMSDRALQTKQIAVKMEEDIAAKKKRRLEESGAAETLQRYAGVLREKVKDRRQTSDPNVYETFERPMNSEERNKHLSDAILELSKYGDPGIKASQVIAKAFTKDAPATLEEAVLRGDITQDEYVKLKHGADSEERVIGRSAGSKPGSTRILFGKMINGQLVQTNEREIGGTSETEYEGYRMKKDTEDDIDRLLLENRQKMSKLAEFASGQVLTNFEGAPLSEEATRSFMEVNVNQMNDNELKVAHKSRSIQNPYRPKTFALEPETGRVVVVDDPSNPGMKRPEWYTGRTMDERFQTGEKPSDQAQVSAPKNTPPSGGGITFIASRKITIGSKTFNPGDPITVPKDAYEKQRSQWDDLVTKKYVRR